MAAENLIGNLPNKSLGDYQRPLPRDFETATKGAVSWKNENSTFAWNLLPIFPAGTFTSLDSSVVASDGAIYIGNGDTTAVSSEWGAGVTQYDWLRYTADTSSYGYITPTEGQLCYDTNTGAWYTYDTSSTGWLLKSGAYTKTTIEIGDWDMDTTSIVNLLHGLSATEWKTIRNIEAIIRNDADSQYQLLQTFADATTLEIAGGVRFINSTTIRLTRFTTGIYDSVNYDSTGYNRGFVTFEYIKD